jgi:hypothetical protein
MKLVVSALALASLASCSAHPRVLADEFVEAPPPAPPLKVQVSFMPSLESASTTTDATIGKDPTDWTSHGVCFFGPTTRYLIGLSPWNTTISASPTVTDYLTAADNYVQALRIVSGLDWGVDQTHAYKGHCWNNTNQVWEDCPSTGTAPPNSYAFQLLQKTGTSYTPYFDFSKVKNPAATININYYVIVQLQ